MPDSARTPNPVVPLIALAAVTLLIVAGRMVLAPAAPVTALSPCFVLPGAVSGTTQSYRVLPGGMLERAGDATGGAWHMRAAFHPDGRTLYINSVGPDGRTTYITYPLAATSLGDRMPFDAKCPPAPFGRRCAPQRPRTA